MYEPKTKPWNHQLEAWDRSRGRECFAWLMEMGTGKTKAMIDAFGELYDQGTIDAVLILAPKGVHSNWTETEIPEHMPEALVASSSIHAWAGGGTARERMALAAFFEGPPRLRILTINIEALAASTKVVDWIKEFIRQFRGRFVCIVDESTTIKNHSAARTKRAIKIGAYANRRWIATGSPVTKNPLDLFSQFEFMGDRLLGHRSFYSFQAEFCIMKEIDQGGRKVRFPVSFRHLDDLSAMVSEHSYRKLKKDCLDLPPKIYAPKFGRVVEMTDEQRRVYASIRDIATAELQQLDANGEPLYSSATAIITQMLRLHQICTGFVVDEEGNEHDLPCLRPQEMLNDIEQTGIAPTIIWCAYRRNVTAVVNALTKAHGAGRIVQYHGGIKDADRTLAKKRFQDGDAPFLVATKAMARGHTLNRAEYVKFYSTTHDLEDRQQEEDRAHRGEMDHNVVYTDYHCPGTVEGKIIKNLRNKIDISSTILGDGYKEWLI